MTIREMHIDFDIDLQKVNSNLFAKIKPEEKDRILNRAISRYINTCIRPKVSAKDGFEKDTKGLDSISDIVETVQLPLYKVDNRSVMALLPANYQHKVKITADVSYGCSSIASNITTVNKYIYTAIFTLPDDSSNLYAGFTITLINLSGVPTTLFNIANYPHWSTGLADQDLKFELIELIRAQIQLTFPNIEIYYEKFNGKIYNGKFILIVKDTNGNSVQYTSIKLTTTGLTINTTTTFTTHSFTGYTVSSSVATRISRVDIVSSEDVEENLDNNFTGTGFDSVVGKIEGGRVFLYYNNKFIPTALNLTQIRKPQRVDIYLGQNCDLNENVHDEVVEIGVQLAQTQFTANLKATREENLINK